MNTLSTTLLGAVFAVLAVFFAAPMVAGGSTNICKDVEAHNVQTAASAIAGNDSGTMYSVINSIGQAGATGDIERYEQRSAHPHIPLVVSCTVAFWRSL